ncbi:MAG: hypothetical protein ABSG74_01700 [Candidatus Bathyarchaeia archaeon]
MEKEEGELGFIADQIEKTGYPLEMHASEVLEKKDWNVLHSTFYRDSETGIMREIDIRADKAVDRSAAGDTIRPYRLNLRLVIQCKKSDSVAWVFFVTKRKTEEMATSPRFLDYLYVAKTSSLSRLYSPYPATGPTVPTLSLGIARSLKHVGDLKVVNPTTFRSLSAIEQAKTYKEIKMRKVQDSGATGEYPAIYEAAMTVLKATDFDFNNVYTTMQLVVNGRLSGMPLPPGIEIGDIQLYIPIILFEGRLITWQDGHLKKTDQVLLQSQVLSKGFFIPSPSIVVVQRDHLNDFLESIDEDLLVLADRIHKNRDTLDEQLRLLTQQFAGTDSTPPMRS